MTNVEELKGLLERATKGPWAYSGDNDGDFVIWKSDESFLANVGGGFVVPVFASEEEDEPKCLAFDTDKANAQLIVAAVNALPALLLERERLREACKKALTCGLDSSVRELVASALRGERTP